ncbi:MAG TPA: hypothetical protein VMT78_12315 [Terriglobia bacterium]|nr:hypothetical protein [Terriglobia bacterium]
MKWLRASIVLLSLQAVSAGPQAAETAVRFETVDVFVDTTDKALAAYQLEFFAGAGDAKIAGIEGGMHPAFATPPYYDPKAMQQDRVILGAFTTNEATALPTGKTRVATIHLQTVGTPPDFQIRLQAAADADGKTITAEATFQERNTR